MRFFNTAGPCKPDIHYALPSTARLPEARNLIDQQNYFVLHAPRQVGKTTSLLTLGQELTAEGKYAAVLLSMEVGAAFNQYPGKAEAAVLGAWRLTAQHWLPPDLQPPPWPETIEGERIITALTTWARACPRPLVVFLDEIDALQDETLISVLRQLRNGYFNRPQGFPWSLALIGLRDVRDYKVGSGGRDRLHSSSPFNIKAESLTLRNFNAAEVAELYGQHTTESGQVFTDEAVEYAFHLTQGQPWLVNALARQATEVFVRDIAQPITKDTIEQAKERLIERQDTHLDSLAERLREPRVRHIIEPILTGESAGAALPADDLQFVVDLGLVRRSAQGGIEIANPIYQEVIPTALASVTRDFLPRIEATWLQADGRLDAQKLLEAFLEFWREHGEPLLKSVHYHEIAPHIVLMAFLHRVVNGGGFLTREYALGTKRIDICLRYGADKLAIELKVWRDKEKDPLPKGLKQLDGYLAKLGLESGWLVIFDQRSGLPPIEERATTEKAVTPSGREVIVIRA